MVFKTEFRFLQVKSTAECSKGSILHLGAFFNTVLLTFNKLPFVIKIFVLSIFEWPLKTDFTVHYPESKQHRQCAEPLVCAFDVHMQQIRISQDKPHITV